MANFTDIIIANRKLGYVNKEKFRKFLMKFKHAGWSRQLSRTAYDFDIVSKTNKQYNERS